jgi:hypothetical protein
MARQVKSKVGWNWKSNNKIAHRTGLLGVIRNILGLNHHVDESTPCVTYGRVEGSKAYLGFASAKEAETLLRRARMLQ